MFALGSYWFALLTLERPLSWMVGMIVWRYAAIPFIFAPLNTASLLLLPPDKVRMGSGLINLPATRYCGTVGLALMITVLQRRRLVHAGRFDAHQAFSSLHWEDVFGRFQDIVVQAGEVDAMVHTKALASCTNIQASHRVSLSRLLWPADHHDSRSDALGILPTQGRRTEAALP